MNSLSNYSEALQTPPLNPRTSSGRYHVLIAPIIASGIFLITLLVPSADLLSLALTSTTGFVSLALLIQSTSSLPDDQYRLGYGNLSGALGGMHTPATIVAVPSPQHSGSRGLFLSELTLTGVYHSILFVTLSTVMFLYAEWSKRHPY